MLTAVEAAPEAASAPVGLTREDVSDLRFAAGLTRELLDLAAADCTVRVTVTCRPEKAAELAKRLEVEGKPLGPNYRMYLLHEEHPTDLEPDRPEIELVLLADRTWHEGQGVAL